MRIVFSSYAYSKGFHEPQEWFRRINAYGGVLESLAQSHEVISIELIDYEGRVRNNGVDYRFKYYSAKALRFFPRQLNQYIKQLKPDVVIIHGLHFPLQIIQLRLTLGSDVKIIVQNHAEKAFTSWRKIFQQLADRCINAYFFASRDMGLEWVTAGNLASAKKIHEVMEVSSVFYPIDKIEARRQTGVTGKQVFLWVGRLNANKDPLTVVNAFLQYLQLNPQARLYMIYGTDELLPAIKRILVDSKYRENILLVGKKPHTELLYWFNSADFILSGSHYEGGGASVCEAMSCGCVLIVTDILSFRAITNNGACGILYEAGNEAALLTALQQTIYMDTHAKGEQSLEHFKTSLSFEAIAGKIAQIVSSL
ncbi:MAG: glycosyltransferase family 4 protein [Chitinophagaceae bacterium]